MGTHEQSMSRYKVQKWAEHFRSFSPHAIARLFWSSLGLVCLALFVRLAFSVQMHGSVQSIDENLLRYIGTSIRSPDWNFFFIDLSSLGSLAVMTALCLSGMVMLTLARDPFAAIHLFLTVYGAYRLVFWSKTWIERPRPMIIPKLIEVGGMSFPSGHALTSAAVYLTLAILACRHFKGHLERVVLFWLAGILISAVAFSRVYLGVHWPSDVISGALLGSAWALFLGALFSKRHSVRWSATISR